MGKGEREKERGNRERYAQVNLDDARHSFCWVVCVDAEGCSECLFQTLLEHEPPPPITGSYTLMEHRSFRRKTCREPDGK